MLVARPMCALLGIVVLLLSCSVSAQDSPHIGLKIHTLSIELRKQHNLPADAKGALVIDVVAGSPAQEAGIAAGDVIVEAAGKPVRTAKAVAEKIGAASTSGNPTITLKIMNAQGERRDVSVTIAKKPTDASPPPLPGPK